MDERDEVNEDEAAAEPQEPSTPILERLTDPTAVLLACLALLVALYPAWSKGLMPIRGDALTYFWPLREALASALQQGTLPLYELTNNGGTPLWLNPQTQALYPPARLYGLMPVGAAMGFLHAAHLMLVFGGTVALLRRLNYRYPTASLAALCVALGGTFLSASAMQDKAQTAAWIPLMLWGALSIHERSLWPKLVLAGATTMAVLAGGLDIVVIGICATILAASVAAVPEPEVETEPEEPEPEEPEEDDGLGLGDDRDEEEETDFVPLITGGAEGAQEGGEQGPTLFSELPERLSEAGGHCLQAGLWILLGLGLCATQWLPFRLWLETSDWGAQLEAAELSARSLRFADLLGLVAPNLPYDAGVGEYRLPGSSEAQAVYLPGLYAGGGAVLLACIGLIEVFRRQFSQPRERWLLPGPTAAATLGSLLCVALASGPAIPPLNWLTTHLPILSSIRYPEKWLLLGAVLAAVPIADGARHLAAPRTRNRLLLQVGGGVLGLVLLTAGIGMTAGDGDLGRGMGLAAVAGTAALLTCAAWRLLSLHDRPEMAVVGVSLAILITAVDLGAHNLPLAPLEDPSEIVPKVEAAQRLLLSADQQRRKSGSMLKRRVRLHQASYAKHDKDPVTSDEAPLHQVLREALMGGIPSAWGIEVMRDWLVMAPSGLEKWYGALDPLALARQFDGLRLAGVTHIVVHFRDDENELLPLVGRGLENVLTVNDRWTQVRIFPLTNPLPSCRWTSLGVPASDGLPIVPDEDDNGTWRGRVTNGTGLVVCLRPWDPAWYVEVDGKPVETQIANGFQLALPVGPGAHEVFMEYRPRGMWLAGHLRTLSAGLLFALMGLWLIRKRKKGGRGEDGDEPASSVLTQTEAAEYSGDEATEGYSTDE